LEHPFIGYEGANLDRGFDSVAKPVVDDHILRVPAGDIELIRGGLGRHVRDDCRPLCFRYFAGWIDAAKAYERLAEKGFIQRRRSEPNRNRLERESV
jgi:hypothetical protein